MDYFKFKALIEVYALQVEAKGMEAENKAREMKGEALSYDEESFYKLAEEIRDVLERHDKDFEIMFPKK